LDITQSTESQLEEDLFLHHLQVFMTSLEVCLHLHCFPWLSYFLRTLSKVLDLWDIFRYSWD
jgi:hypothetical protein